MNLMSDPRNKGIEHFSGCRAEDAKAFKVWRAKVYNYIGRFIPGAKGVLTKCVFADTDINDSINDVDGNWNAKYTEAVLKRGLNIFLTEHLDMGAAKIIDGDLEDGVEAWKTLNLFFEPKSQMTLPNLKSKIFDMNKETVKTYDMLEKMLRELAKRTKAFTDRGGAYDEGETADILYTIMDDALKKGVRRCKVAGNSKALRTHIAEEAAENRDSGSSVKKAGGNSSAMDISAVAEGEKSEAPAVAAVQAVAPAGGTGSGGEVNKLEKNQCKICLRKEHWADECPQKPNKGAKGGGQKGDGRKGQGKGLGKCKCGKGFGKGEGKGKNGYGDYGVEDQSLDWHASAGENWGNPPDAWWPSEWANGSASGAWQADPGLYSVARGRLSSCPEQQSPQTLSIVLGRSRLRSRSRRRRGWESPGMSGWTVGIRERMRDSTTFRWSMT